MDPAEGVKSYCLVSPVFQHGVKRLVPFERYVVGRDPRARIHLNSNTVSRRHALLLWIDAEEGGFMLEDLGSRNGVRVGGRKIKRHFLNDDDLIKVGTFKFRFRVMSGDLGMLFGAQAAAAADADETVAMAEHDEVPEGSESRLAGKFARTELLEIVQLIELNSKSGVLQITGSEHSGRIHFRDGRLIQADAGDRQDVEAARLLLELREGAFELIDASKPDRPRDEPISLQALLLELTKARDEKDESGVGSGSGIDDDGSGVRTDETVQE